VCPWSQVLHPAHGGARPKAAIIDLMPPRRQVLLRATLDHAWWASLAIALNAPAAVLVLLRPE